MGVLIQGRGRGGFNGKERRVCGCSDSGRVVGRRGEVCVGVLIQGG